MFRDSDLENRLMVDRSHTKIWDNERLDAVHAQADKSVRVRKMFDAIAPTYERVNSIFSVGRDRKWRKRAVRLAEVQTEDRVLDIACGTGDFLRAFLSHAPQAGTYTGMDFSYPMLQFAASRSVSRLRWLQSDALNLPFADRSFDITSCAFGVRNFQDLDRGFSEMYRVLDSGGRAVILEFSRPENRVFRAFYEYYSGKIMPAGASLISGDKTGAYRYLPRSVVSFAEPEEMAAMLRGVGFSSVRVEPLTWGVVTVYVATKGNA